MFVSATGRLGSSIPGTATTLSTSPESGRDHLTFEKQREEHCVPRSQCQRTTEKSYREIWGKEEASCLGKLTFDFISRIKLGLLICAFGSSMVSCPVEDAKHWSHRYSSCSTERICSRSSTEFLSSSLISQRRFFQKSGIYKENIFSSDRFELKPQSLFTCEIILSRKFTLSESWVCYLQDTKTSRQENEYQVLSMYSVLQACLPLDFIFTSSHLLKSYVLLSVF